MGIGQDYLSLVKAAGTDVQFTVGATFPTVAQRNLPMNDAGSQDMGVLGTLGTPVTFSCPVAADSLLFIYSVPLVIIDTMAMLPGNFGGIAALTNGLELIVRQSGVEKVVCTIKNNKDLSLCYFGGILGSGLPAAAGFFDTAKYATGAFIFDSPVLLDGSKGDGIFFNVQDDLRNLAHLEASAKFSDIPL